MNRADCCGGRINNAKVFVGSKLCGTIKNARQGAWLTLNCRARGNFIKIVGAPRQYLHFCGLRVFGRGCGKIPKRIIRKPSGKVIKIIRRPRRIIRVIRRPGKPKVTIIRRPGKKRPVRIIRYRRKIVKIIRRPGRKVIRIIRRPGKLPTRIVTKPGKKPVKKVIRS